MQDRIETVPQDQLHWLARWVMAIRANRMRTPYVINGNRGFYYRYHDWFWNVGSVKGSNDNVRKK